MRPPSERIRLVREWEEGARGLASAAGGPAWLRTAAALKENDRTSVLAGEWGGERVVVKSMVSGRAKDALARLVRTTRFEREARGSELLRSEGFEAARALALWRGADRSRGRVECLATEFIAGETLLARIAHGGAEGGAAALIKEAGGLTARLVRAGLYNRDHKGSNMIVRAGADARLVMIDAGGVRRARRSDAGARMLAKLLIEMAGMGIETRGGLMDHALRGYEAGFGGAVDGTALRGTIERIIAAHGDPTPKDDPLRSAASGRAGDMD